MLVFDQPIDQGKPDTRASSPAASGFDLLALFRLLWRRKTTIIAAALGCAIAAVVIGKSLSPKFTATAQLYVDPRELQLVDRELTPRAQDVSGLSMVVESQARLITSNSVLLKVIQDTNLDKDPEFGGASRGALTSLLGLFGIRAALRRRAEGRSHHRVGRTRPAHHDPQDRTLLRGRYRGLVLRSGQVCDARQRRRRRLPVGIRRARRRPPRGAPPPICRAA